MKDIKNKTIFRDEKFHIDLVKYSLGDVVEGYGYMFIDYENDEEKGDYFIVGKSNEGDFYENMPGKNKLYAKEEIIEKIIKDAKYYYDIDLKKEDIEDFIEF